MLKRFILPTLTTAAILSAGTATAGPLFLSTGSGGGWSGANAGSGVCVDIDNRSGAARDEIRWGSGELRSGPYAGGDVCWLEASGVHQGVEWTYDDQSPVSGYNLDPFDGHVAYPGSSTLVSLGTFEHLNSAVHTAITDVDYTFNIDHNGAGSPLSFTIGFEHNETDNQGNYPACCDDIVTIVLPTLTTLLQVGEHSYMFQLLGFSSSGTPGSFSSLFSSPENGTNATQLWAQITQQNPVPEPATLTMLGAGLLGLGAAARRRMKKSGKTIV